MGNCHTGNAHGICCKTSVKIQEEAPCSKLLKTWQKVPCAGTITGGRSGHGMVVYQSKVYLFGGCGGESVEERSCLSDFLVFDFSTQSWSAVQTRGEPPHARASFGMSRGPDPGTLIVAGGTGQDMDTFSDIYEYNISSSTWRLLIKGEKANFCKYYGQSICEYKGNLFFFGGSRGRTYSNVLYRYDCAQEEGAAVPTTGKAPCPRYKQQMMVVKDSLLVIGGGNYRPPTHQIDVHELDLLTLNWSQWKTSGNVPQGRVAHTCTYDENTHQIYLWGGFNVVLHRLNDFHVLDIATRKWSTIISLDNQSPRPRAFHCSCLHDGSFYIFGGADGDFRHSDVWRFRTNVTPPSLMSICAGTVAKSQSPKTAADETISQSLPHEVLDGIKQMVCGAERFVPIKHQAPVA
uniref:Uncharacterized protein n=1 Tax=Fibrocapsa japonica TaxID=94617 RepID=A0A7S2XVZ9_9STRA|mmetsp:Transcript_13977/g.20610  ORF Transcript_13977/g.20610 Transcript_13977/m.20610 type:complete len:405 (+) Transcript_13977:71-1285(+)